MDDITLTPVDCSFPLSMHKIYACDENPSKMDNKNWIAVFENKLKQPFIRNIWKFAQ